MNITSLKSYKHFVTKPTEGGMMYLNTLDEYISRDLIYSGKWESYLYPVFEQYIKEGGCALDIGANIGCHSLIFSKLVGDNGEVHCFEPLEELYFQLKFNMLTNKCWNTTTYRYGVSSEKKEMYGNVLNLEKSTNFGAHMLKEDVKTEEGFSKVETISIDDLNLEPTFMKIDAEGMEDKVLLGSAETIKRCKPVILVEIHQSDVEKVFGILKNMNYKVIQKYGPWDYLCVSN